jgi:hypothetical protein
LNFSVNRPSATTQLQQTRPPSQLARTAAPTPSNSGAPPSQASFEAQRLSTLGKSSQVVNPTQAGQVAKQGIDQADGGLISGQAEQLLSSSLLAEAFGASGASPVPSTPSLDSSLTSELLTQGRQQLKPVSQHAVLNLGGFDRTVDESARSLRLKTDGTVFDKDRLPGPQGQLEIVGHGSSDGLLLGGQTANMLAKTLKQAGVTQLDTLHLKSCHSAPFAVALSASLKAEGIQVRSIQGFEGRIAIHETTGATLIETEAFSLGLIDGHSGDLGYSTSGLQSLGLIAAPVTQGAAEIIPFTGSSNQYGTADPKITALVQQTVGKAVDQAFSELLSGDLPSILSTGRPPSGHLENTMARVGVTPPQTDMLIANVGYLIEDRVTQILASQGFDVRNFQQVIGKSRPDIVMGTHGEIRVDITASSSVGHILSKDAPAWTGTDVNGNKIQSFEVIYPSLDIPTALDRLTSGTPIDLATLRSNMDAAKAEKDTFETTIKGGLDKKLQEAFTALGFDGPRGLNGLQKKAVIEHVANALGVGNITVTHTLLKYGRLNLASLYKSTKAPSINSDHVTATVRALEPNNPVFQDQVNRLLYPSQITQSGVSFSSSSSTSAPPLSAHSASSPPPTAMSLSTALTSPPPVSFPPLVLSPPSSSPTVTMTQAPLLTPPPMSAFSSSPFSSTPPGYNPLSSTPFSFPMPPLTPPSASASDVTAMDI